jgi:phosphocarrier protein HPr
LRLPQYDINVKLSRKVIIQNDLGLHARAAAKIAQLAEGARSKVYIVKDGQEVDATSILDVIALYCPSGTEVLVKITGPGDVEVLNRIVRLIETGFGES